MDIDLFIIKQHRQRINQCNEIKREYDNIIFKKFLHQIL